MKAILLTVLVIFAAGSSALGQLPRRDDTDPDAGFCVEESGVVTGLKTTGAHLPGATIGIRAEPLTIWAKTTPRTNPKFCRPTSGIVPRGNWTWEVLERPALSKSQLGGTTEATVTLLLDQPGVYRIRFTACARGCELKVPDHTPVLISPAISEIVIRVLAILPPDKFAVVPPFAETFPRNFSSHCPWDADYLSSAWRTVNVWKGPSDYKTLEGVVVSSSVSNVDNNFNHDGMDWNIDVIPDPSSRGLLAPGQTEVEIEWERGHLPETFRPTEGDRISGDRISAIGYWVYDCGHGAKTEIHPPVLLATHRPRAIALPTSAGAGSNVYVPGIVTDIWVSREAGNITNGCAGTGLDQQKDPSKPFLDKAGRPISRCLPDSEGFSSNPINRLFEFNIYLPRNPRAILAALGRTAPEVPLHLEGCLLNASPGLEPVCELATKGGVQYLKVRIDLSSYTQGTYSRRIVAGWAHAAPDNWGARRWNVRVTSLDVTDDADSRGKGDGDWRFWVNTNNGASEWAKLLDGGGNAHGMNSFGGSPWETNALRSDRSLGPSIVLFPNQFIWLATRGFENDWYYEDSVASLSMHLPQVRVSDGQVTADDGDGKYIMHYQVRPGAEIGGAQLSPAARARYDAYFLTNNNLSGATTEGLALVDGVFNAGFGRPKQSLSASGEREREKESLWVTRMSVEEIRQRTQRAVRENPAKLNAFFKALKKVLQSAATPEDKVEANEFLTRVKAAISPDLWRKHALAAEQRLLIVK